LTKHGSNLAASALIFSSIYCRKFGRFMFFINRRWHATCHTFRCLVGRVWAQICGVQICGHGVCDTSRPVQRACGLTLAVQRTSCSVGGLMRAVAGCGMPLRRATEQDRRAASRGCTPPQHRAPQHGPAHRPGPYKHCTQQVHNNLHNKYSTTYTTTYTTSSFP